MTTCISEPAILFGHSLGGTVAIVIAVQDPSLVKALVLGDTSLNLEQGHSIHKNTRETILAWSEYAGSKRPIAEIASKLAQGNDAFLSDKRVPVRTRR